MRTMRRFGLIDICAMLVLCAYVWLAQATEQGAADPVWRRVQERGVLIVGTDISFAPFVYQQPDGTLAGYDVELVNEIGRCLGVQVEWRQVGYDALYSAIDPGNPNHVDLLAAGLILNPAEGWRARFSQAYFDAGQQVVVAPTAPYTSAYALSSATIAVQLGSPGETAARALAAADPSISIDNSAQTQAAAIEQVLRGSADAAVIENTIALPALNQQQVRSLGGLNFEPYVLAVPVSAYQLQAEINRILSDLNSEGWIGQLNQRIFR